MGKTSKADYLPDMTLGEQEDAETGQKVNFP